MRASTSQRDFGEQRTVSRSRSQRAIYLNQEVDKRETSTPFHSPYKGGKPNPDYHNPSFISSNLFYAPEYTQNNPSIHVTKNVLPNCNDIKRDKLQKSRLKTQDSKYNAQKQLAKQRSRDFNNSRGNQPPVLRNNEPETLLKHQLETLHNYRQNCQQVRSRLRQLSRKRDDGPQQPIFMQPLSHNRQKRVVSRSPLNKQNRPDSHKQDKASVKGHANVRDDDSYSANLSRLIKQNNDFLLQQEQRRVGQSQLLGNILRQQIKTNKVLKERRWNY